VGDVTGVRRPARQGRRERCIDGANLITGRGKKEIGDSVALFAKEPEERGKKKKLKYHSIIASDLAKRKGKGASFLSLSEW